MRTDNDETYYGRRAQQQLEIARAAIDPAIKSIHLDLASRYATLSELATRDRQKDDPNQMPSMRIAGSY